jgi:hypothetical protein
MRMRILGRGLLAVLIFLALFAYRLAWGPRLAPQDGETYYGGQQSSIQMVRKNYATTKMAPAAGTPAGDSKYEKVATLAQNTSSYDADRKRLDEVIAAHQGIVQYEHNTGLTGRRTLSLGIGMPPDRFDAFIEVAKTVGRGVQIEVTKNDKTNEYLQLRAKRATLEKARSGIESLLAAGGSIDERIRAQDKLTSIEERLQELTVSLGEFDTQNELCTVKLTLAERALPLPRSLSWRITDAIEWAGKRFAFIGVGFLGLVIGCWLAVLAFRMVREDSKTSSAFRQGSSSAP